ncbi:hypothetical protein K435DRAFT_808504 [Dendrothele bispora CBS 962.96]|uniref:Uncharacterized protein n=1 Tax=Dendrothele bispora (strain CBS 962.96) TaxID=1314807 RepID=A0A4S8L2H1_DENBC|nr:hypothetical protein K435DRAFT_808504 [Dendrothele bispora CBS 962.96]
MATKCAPLDDTCNSEVIPSPKKPKAIPEEVLTCVIDTVLAAIDNTPVNLDTSRKSDVETSSEFDGEGAEEYTEQEKKEHRVFCDGFLAAQHYYEWEINAPLRRKISSLEDNLINLAKVNAELESRIEKERKGFKEMIGYLQVRPLFVRSPLEQVYCRGQSKETL